MQTKQIEVSCNNCSKRFSRCVSDIKRNKRHFCNRKCFHEAKLTDEHKEKIRKGVKNNLPSTAYKKGRISQYKGKKRPEMAGDKHPNWKGGRQKTSDGYISVKQPNHPFVTYRGNILEHRLIMEKHLGRFLKPYEVVHHVNHIRADNRIENLKLVSSNSEHQKLHPRERNKKGQFMLQC